MQQHNCYIENLDVTLQDTSNEVSFFMPDEEEVRHYGRQFWTEDWSRRGKGI